MERRYIVAAIVKIANELDSLGMYQEANELTKVAQAAGQEFMKGLQGIGSGAMRGIKGFGKDVGKGLKGTYDATKQGLSDAGEVLGNMGAEAGYGTDAAAREVYLGASYTSNSSIDSQIEALQDQLGQHNKQAVEAKANSIYSNIQEKINQIQKSPGAQTTGAKNEINNLRAKQLQVMKLRDKFKPGNPGTMSNRANVGQFSTLEPELKAFISNRAKGDVTKAQLYEMALQDKDENFANSMAAYLTNQGYRNRTDLVRPTGYK